jgi:hypothetical protein
MENRSMWLSSGCSNVSFEALNWFSEDDFVCFKDKFDIILGADIGFDVSLHEPIKNIIFHLLPEDANLSVSSYYFRLS